MVRTSLGTLEIDVDKAGQIVGYAGQVCRSMLVGTHGREKNVTLGSTVNPF